MIGRWALAKPWVFREWNEERDLEMDAQARLAVLRRYVELCLEQLGDDERGRARVRRFLTFHQDFFARYRRGGREDAVNDEDPRGWAAGVDALADWLIDGGPADPPPPPGPEARRAVRLRATG